VLNQQDEKVKNFRSERDGFTVSSEQAFGNILTKRPEDEHTPFSIRYRHFGVASRSLKKVPLLRIVDASF